MSRDWIVVTGASRGIGAAISYQLAARGHHVACLSRSGKAPVRSDVAPEVAARWAGYAADVTDPASVRNAIEAVVRDGGRIVGMVNNAGIHLEGPSADLPLAQWHDVMNTNATSVLTGCQAVYPKLVASGGGLIVNIGSFVDKLGIKRNLAYCASKAAVGAITRCLAVEWASDRIRVLDVAPGYVVTDLNVEIMAAGALSSYLEKRIPRGTPGTADEIGRLVATLFTPGLDFLTGETIYVDGAHGIRH